MTEPVADELLELAPGEAFVAEQALPGAHQMVLALEQGLGDFTFADLGVAGPR